MKRSQRHAAARAWGLAAVVVGASAQAQQPVAAEATRFEFRAPAGCSSAADFSARVSKRSWRIRLVSDPHVQRSLVVEIQQVPLGSALRGTVTVVEADGATRKRQLKAANCDEAVDALSLIATVTLDADAMLGEPPPDEPERPAQAEPPGPKPSIEVPPPVDRAPPTEPYRFSLGLAPTLLVRMAPEPALGGTASAALEVDPGRIWAPFIRISLTHAQRRDVAERGGAASFAFTLPTLDLCPVRLGPRALGLRPCAHGTVGALKVWGEGTRLNETHVRVVGAAGPGAWLGWRISETFEIIADARASWPFRRDELAFDGAVFFKTPTPGFSFGLGAAGGFP